MPKTLTTIHIIWILSLQDLKSLSIFPLILNEKRIQVSYSKSTLSISE
jgi:hypothetical protein